MKLAKFNKDNNASINHIESRRSYENYFEIYLEIKCNSLEYSKILFTLHNSSNLSLINTVNKETNEKIWIPLSIYDLDYCNHLDTNFEPHIDSKHAGFADINYRKRRLQIANIALAYKQYSQFKLKIIL